MHYRFSNRQEHNLDAFLLQSAQLVFGEEQVKRNSKIRNTLREYKLRILQMKTCSFTIDVKHVQMFIFATVCNTTVVCTVKKQYKYISTFINSKIFDLERVDFFGYTVFDPGMNNLAQTLVNIHDAVSDHIVTFSHGVHVFEYTFEQYTRDLYSALTEKCPKVTRVLGDDDTAIEVITTIARNRTREATFTVCIENKKTEEKTQIHANPFFDMLETLLLSNNNNTIQYEHFYVKR